MTDNKPDGFNNQPLPARIVAAFLLLIICTLGLGAVGIVLGMLWRGVVAVWGIR